MLDALAVIAVLGLPETFVVDTTADVIDAADGPRLVVATTASDVLDVHLGALPYVRLDIPLPPSAGPGPPLRILGFLLPRDDDATLVHFPRFREVSGRERTIWRSLYKLRLRGTHLHVLNQDKRMLESMRTVREARRNEHLAQADRPVVHLRRTLEPAFEAQRERHGLT